MSMSTSMIGRLAKAAIVATAMVGACGAQAADYPVRPITVVVPYGAGGAGDTTMRLLASVMEKDLGQSFVIEAKPGGGGTLGARLVANATPDGYTLLLGAANNFVINQYMFPRQKFDPLTSFELITKVASVPSVMYVSNAITAKTLGDFVARAKKEAGRMSYASPSVGTVPHLAVEHLLQMTGAQIVHVPYRGAPPAMQALLRNDVQLYLAGWGVGRAYVSAGQVRALAVASAKRIDGIPLPTAAESGAPGFVAENWWGLAAPKGTPGPVLDRLYRSVAAALKDRTVVERLHALGFVPGGEPPETFLAGAKAEAAVWKQTVETGNLAVK